MSQVSDPSELTYPDKPDANGYAKKYFKRRAFYFGAHNSPESFLLFGEWKRRLVENGEPAEVKQIRKELAHQGLPGPHGPLSAREGQQPIQYAMYASVAASVLFAWALLDRYFFSSTTGPTVDGITLTNEEIDFVRGIRKHKGLQDNAVGTRASEIASLADKLLEEGPESAAKYLDEENRVGN
jgi:hypothetical protein